MKRLAPLLTSLLFSTCGIVHAQWATNPHADLLLGNRETLANSISSVCCIAVDEAHEKIYVCCKDSNRVLRFATDALRAGGPLTTVDAVFGQPDAYSDGHGLSDTALYHPTALAVDAAGNLWVSDSYNRRVLRFDRAYAKPTGGRADGVLGSPNFTTITYLLSTAVCGLAVDSFGNLFVSDAAHACVYRFNGAAAKSNGALPDAVFGQTDLSGHDQGLSATKMHNPRGICVTGTGTTRLWVADEWNNRVLRFDNAHTAASGAAAAFVLGQPDMTTNAAGSAMSRFNHPWDVAVLGSNLYVSDTGNHRAMRFPGASPAANAAANATLAIATDGLLSGPKHFAVEPNAGRLWCARESLGAWFDQPGTGQGILQRTGVFGSEEQTLWSPRDIAIHPVTGKVFVTDHHPTSRGVARYSSYASLTSGALPEAWVCARQSAANFSLGGGIFDPEGLCLDPQGRLWVADPSSRAVYCYDNASTMGAWTEASGYLGGASGSGAHQMLRPMDVYADPQGRVWVVDTDNHRVLRFDNAANKADGAPADGVLGQGGFGEGDVGSPPNSWNLNLPKGITGDGAGNIWVADTGNNRVLRYSNAAAKVNGGAMNGVLGQLTSGWSGAGLGPNSMDQPVRLAWEAGGHLWVSEAGNNRVTRFKNANSLANGAFASMVIGQPDFWHNDTRPDLNHAVDPCGLAVDLSGRVWVADAGGDRIMRFSPGELRITASGITAQHKFRLQYTSVAGVQYDIESSTDLLYWSYEGTQVAGGLLTDWMSFQNASGRRFYRVSEK